jgi:hypothetical protein
MPFINGKFYMNLAYGRALENARANESTDGDQGGHWVTINGRHVLIQEQKPQAAQKQQVTITYDKDVPVMQPKTQQYLRKQRKQQEWRA